MIAIDKLDVRNVGIMFRNRRQKIAGWRTSLNAMIGHDHAHDVLCSPARHMARHAVICRDIVRFLFVTLMATKTDGRDLPKTSVGLQRLMRVMTRSTSDSAFDVTSTLLQAVHMMIDLETVVAFAAGLVDV
ncbi:MAG TPA: hypothetical protein VJ032_04600, partial [Thermoanaerobaculia bacterium]|nr:hypothetical protein [Thermoanaerobaculia bacterium]